MPVRWSPQTGRSAIRLRHLRPMAPLRDLRAFARWLRYLSPAASGLTPDGLRASRKPASNVRDDGTSG